MEPNLPCLSQYCKGKDVSVAKKLWNLDGSNLWEVDFMKVACNEELDLLAYFFVQSYWVWIRHGREDKMLWALSKRGMFELKLFYCALYPNEQSSFPWKSIWSKAPLRRSLLGMWLHGRPSHWKTSRKWQIIVINWCFICKRDGKLITCTYIVK